MTGGPFAARARSPSSITLNIFAPRRQGGMAAVANSEHFAARIAQNQANRDRLMAQTPEAFIAVMEKWCDLLQPRRRPAGDRRNRR